MTDQSNNKPRKDVHLRDLSDAEFVTKLAETLEIDEAWATRLLSQAQERLNHAVDGDDEDDYDDEDIFKVACDIYHSDSGAAYPEQIGDPEDGNSYIDNGEWPCS